MALMGVTYGFSNTVSNALWPEVYGLRHLGAMRALTVAVGVFATAMGPGITGFLIDRGVSFPGQIVAMGLYCFAACFLLAGVARRLRLRAGPPSHDLTTSAQ